MFRNAVTILTTLLLLLSTVVSPAVVQAQSDWSGVCLYESSTGSGADKETYQVATIQGLQCLIGNVLQVAVTVVGLAGFVMLIFGAFKYQLSGGDSKATQEARSTLTFAIVGIAVVLSAYIILNLISAFTGVEVIKEFRIWAEL